MGWGRGGGDLPPSVLRRNCHSFFPWTNPLREKDCAWEDQSGGEKRAFCPPLPAFPPPAKRRQRHERGHKRVFFFTDATASLSLYPGASVREKKTNMRAKRTKKCPLFFLLRPRLDEGTVSSSLHGVLMSLFFAFFVRRRMKRMQFFFVAHLFSFIAFSSVRRRHKTKGVRSPSLPRRFCGGGGRETKGRGGEKPIKGVRRRRRP